MGALRDLFEQADRVALLRGERPMLVWCRTSYDDGEDDYDGRPRPEVRHAYVTRGSALGDGWFYPALCMPSNLGDPFHWLITHPELQHAPRCAYCLAVVVEIARRLVDRLGIVAEPPLPPVLSLLDRQLKIRCPQQGCRAEAGAHCVGGTGRVWTAQVHLARKKAARMAGFVTRRHEDEARTASRKRAAR